MTTKTSAWRVLLEDNNLSADDATILTSLLTSNPVAISSQDALFPLGDLFPAKPRPKSPMKRFRVDDVKRQQLDRLRVLIQKPLAVRSETASGSVTRAAPLVATGTIESDSDFLRYTINPDLLALLEDIRVEQRLDSIV